MPERKIKALEDMEAKLIAVKMLDKGLMATIREIKDEAVQGILLSEARNELANIVGNDEEEEEAVKAPKRKRQKLSRNPVKSIKAYNPASGMRPLSTYWGKSGNSIPHVSIIMFVYVLLKKLSKQRYVDVVHTKKLYDCFVSISRCRQNISLNYMGP